MRSLWCYTVMLFLVIGCSCRSAQSEETQNNLIPFQYEFPLPQGKITGICFNGYLYYVSPNGTLVQAQEEVRSGRIKPIRCEQAGVRRGCE